MEEGRGEGGCAAEEVGFEAESEARGHLGPDLGFGEKEADSRRRKVLVRRDMKVI